MWSFLRADLAQHARDLTELLEEELAELPPDNTIATLQAAANEMGARLATIERDLSGGRLQ